MIDPLKYANAREFRQALDAKVKGAAQASAKSFEDVRRQIVFNRFLARLDFSKFILTGGYSLELRLPLSRSTTDIDLYARDVQLLVVTLGEQDEAILLLLREQAEKDLRDHFAFEVERVLGRIHGTKEGGVRCLVVAKVNGRVYYKFHVDVALCVELLKPDVFTPKTPLPFSEGAETSILVLQKEELFANKIHAYTRQRLTENSRVEDLVDMALLIADGLLVEQVQLAITGVFKASSDHQEIPPKLLVPPDGWKQEFANISVRRNLNLNIDQAFEVVSSFYAGLIGGL